MEYRTQLLFVLLLVLITFSEANPYCEQQFCNKSSHTLCRFPMPIIAYRCQILLRHGLTIHEIHTIVELHNAMRSNVYAGRELRGNPGPLPRAHYFTYLQWDNELAMIAQRWAEQCDFRQDLCRHVDRFLVGQLVGSESIMGDVELLTVDLPIRKWYDEVERFSKDQIFNFDRFYAQSTRTDRFSQIIWSHTTRIGCGAMRFFDGLYSRLILVCNYAPRGNTFGKSIYPVLRYHE